MDDVNFHVSFNKIMLHLCKLYEVLLLRHLSGSLNYISTTYTQVLLCTFGAIALEVTQILSFWRLKTKLFFVLNKVCKQVFKQVFGNLNKIVTFYSHNAWKDVSCNFDLESTQRSSLCKAKLSKLHTDHASCSTLVTWWGCSTGYMKVRQ